MTHKFGFSEIECKIIQAQIERRDKYRKEFLKLRTDPCKHANEAGCVFDPAIQRFLSMKATQLEYFTFNFNTIRFALLSIVAPMVSYGILVYNMRTNREREIRCGSLRYKDRMFKLK